MTEARFLSAAEQEKQVYGACEPGFGHSIQTIPDWIEFMQAQQIDRILCLLDQQQLREHDNLIEKYGMAFGTQHVEHVPTSDHRLIPEAALKDEILPVIEQSVEREESIVVHCKAGIGRTGQTLAAWLVYWHGYEPIEAIETVKDRYRRPDEAVERGYARRQDLIRLLESVY